MKSESNATEVVTGKEGNSMNPALRNFANVRQNSNKRNELLRLVAAASFMRIGSGSISSSRWSKTAAIFYRMR